MDFAAAHVHERAAIPKLVKIMPSLPLTGIGKIFKPALQQREIEAAVRVEAQKVGATIVDLAFERSPRLGQVVRVRAGERTEALRAALERYAFNFEVSPPMCGAHEDMAGDC
jgi:fatty-acyl-CoA synthase